MNIFIFFLLALLKFEKNDSYAVFLDKLCSLFFRSLSNKFFLVKFSKYFECFFEISCDFIFVKREMFNSSLFCGWWLISKRFVYNGWNVDWFGCRFDGGVFDMLMVICTWEVFNWMATESSKKMKMVEPRNGKKNAFKAS